MTEKIMTLHPQGKSGVNIGKDRYDIIRGAILDSLQEHGGMTFTRLMEEVRRRLEGRFEGSVNWYVTTVKLDLEARGEVERVPGQTPQELRLSDSRSA